MALTHNGTKVSIPAAQLPSGYTKPTVTEFTDYENQYISREFTIAKSTVENATGSVTFAAIVSALNTAIEALITADFDTAGLTVTSWADLTAISTNDTLAAIKYTTGTPNYICTVTIKVKTA